jgi:outer membrane protein TolC
MVRLPPVAAEFNGATPGGTRSDIRLASHDGPVIAPAVVMAASEIIPGPPAIFAPGNHTTHRYPIDLASALALGGANNLQIQLARERVVQAEARWSEARLALLPNLTFGVGYNKHDGRLQATEGDVIEAPRNSLFVGGGLGLNGVPLADAAFEPLAARQDADAQSAAEAVATNDTLVTIDEAYYDLVEAHSLTANATAGLAAGENMVKLTTDFADDGQGAMSEVYRAQTELAYWQQVREDALRATTAAAAELARLLRLDSQVGLVPVDEHITPVVLVAEGLSVEQLVAIGLGSRPELAQHASLVEAAMHRMRQEGVRPWLPYIQLAGSGGSFGGGRSTRFDSQGGRSDVDLMATWELRNLGFGNRALFGQRTSQMRQARLGAEAVQDTIVAEIITAAADVGSYRRQVESGETGVTAAGQSCDANYERIREGEGLPLNYCRRFAPAPTHKTR